MQQPPSGNGAPPHFSAAGGVGGNAGVQQQQVQNSFAAQQQRQRDPWPAAMFSLPSSSNASSSQQQQQHSRSIAGFSSSGRGPDGSSQVSLTNLMPSMGLTGGQPAAAAAAAAAGDPTTPVGSPVKVNRGLGSAAGADSAAHCLGSPPSWFSPKSRVRYSDRFIPSRWARTASGGSVLLLMAPWAAAAVSTPTHKQSASALPPGSHGAGAACTAILS